MSDEVKYPDIKVKLVGKDSNIFNLMGIVSAALKNNGVSDEEVSQFCKEVLEQKDYYLALAKIMDWVEVD